MGPDPISGLLTQNFTFYFGMGNSSSEEFLSSSDGRPVGVVRVNDPIQTLLVSTTLCSLHCLLHQRITRDTHTQ